MISNTQIDGTDIKILRLLQQNAKLTTKQLAEQVNLSPTPVFERLKRLESEGYIKKYVAILDADKLGRSFMVFTSVKLKQSAQHLCRSHIRQMSNIALNSHFYRIRIIAIH